MSKLSVKHFELLTRGTYVCWNYKFKKNAQNVLVTFMEKWKKEKKTGYLVFGDKNEVFLFVKKDKY